jgi:hypothetical protein
MSEMRKGYEVKNCKCISPCNCKPIAVLDAPKPISDEEYTDRISKALRLMNQSSEMNDKQFADWLKHQQIYAIDSELRTIIGYRLSNFIERIQSSEKRLDELKEQLTTETLIGYNAISIGYKMLEGITDEIERAKLSLDAFREKVGGVRAAQPRLCPTQAAGIEPDTAAARG